MDPEHEEVLDSCCKADTTEPLNDILAAYEGTGRHQQILDIILSHGVNGEALAVIKFILSKGADSSVITPDQVVRHVGGSGGSRTTRSINKDVVLLLQSHGWDINCQRRKDWPLLWLLAGETALATWCIQQGAKVDLTPVYASEAGNLGRSYRQQSLLETVLLSNGDLALLKEIRRQGAPLKPICLHIAARRACTATSVEKEVIQQRVDILEYLLDEEKLDINGMDVTSEEYSALNNDYLGRPLAYCISTSDQGVHALEFLLSRGADPNLKPELRVYESQPTSRIPEASPLGIARGKSENDPRAATFVRTVEAFYSQNS